MCLLNFLSLFANPDIANPNNANPDWLLSHFAKPNIAKPVVEKQYIAKTDCTALFHCAFYVKKDIFRFRVYISERYIRLRDLDHYIKMKARIVL